MPTNLLFSIGSNAFVIVLPEDAGGGRALVIGLTIRVLVLLVV